mmetsp:Transcript_41842/g.64005  ORF Transcript_41842/g.64005 Transcript_41842/m.64005 type:complete len:457 (-) Transcript_41842:45-1415(-)
MYESDYRQEIFDAMKWAFWKSNRVNLPVYGVPDKLKDYHTSKKDISNGIEVNPQENFRLHGEDIYEEKPGAKHPSPINNNASSTASSNSSNGSQDDIFQWNQEFQKNRSDTLFMKNKNEKKVDLKDFHIKSVIGRGSFGKVFLVQKVQDGRVFAMKSLRKDVILDYDQIESTLLEKEILLKADHPFLVGMEYVFQTEQKIFFVMKFVRGGELFMHLRKARQFSEDRAKFYAITVALSLGHLHSQKIIYRDLKPENILMGEDGYVCLTDFGLAKILDQNEQAYSFCGTPEYLAPEILDEKGHSFPVDWWALGILTYEMIVGFPPFYTGSPNNQKMYDLIKTKPVFFPDAKKHGIAMSANCKDFINKCLSKNPAERLGTNTDVKEIIGHPWFSDINFDKLLAKQVDPEFKPKLTKNPLDVSNFDKMFTSDEAAHSVLPMSTQKKIQKANDKFKGFDDN